MMRSVSRSSRTSSSPLRLNAVSSHYLPLLLAVVFMLVTTPAAVRGEDAVECNICGDLGTIGQPDVIVQEPIGGTNMSCADLQTLADAGEFNTLQCTIVQFAISAPCGCEGAAPSLTPAEPTASPVVASTPTGDILTNVTSRIIIEFTGVSGRMNPNLTEWFEIETCSFLSGYVSTDASGLDCLVLDQALGNESVGKVLGVMMQVVAQEASLGSGEELSTQLASTITSNSDAYLSALDRPFFNSVTNVDAFAVGDQDTTAPTAAPPVDAPVATPVTTPTPSIISAPATEAPVVVATTSSPSFVPVTATTTPTAVPTTGQTTPLVELSGRVELLMKYVVGEMDDYYLGSFENTTSYFLASYLGTGSTPVLDIATTVLEQTAGAPVETRDTGKPLTLILDVTGKRKFPVEFSEMVAAAMNTYSAEYVQALQDSPTAPLQIYFKSVQNITATAMDLPPSAAPVAISLTDPPTSPASSNSGLSGGAIAGIVIGVLVGLALVAVTFRRVYSDNSKPPSRHAAVMLGNHDQNPPTTSYSTPSTSLPSALKKSTPFNQQAEEAPPVKKPVTEDDTESSLPAGVSAATSPSMMVVGATANDDNDNESFAYSLNDDLETNTRNDGETTVASSMFGGGDSSSMGGTSGVTSGATASSASEEGRVRKYKRSVVAPEGKLGIIIDTTVEGPVVYKVNANSPLDGLIFPGDLIIQIDDVETRAMSANNITTLMVQTAGQKRTLTVLSDDPSR